MEVKEVFVTRKNLADIFSIIEDELSIRPDTQVFVDYEIFHELKINGLDYGIGSPNFCPQAHHYFEGTEDWLATVGRPFSEFYGSFVHNCKKYMQLSEFHSPKISRYVHFNSGFEQLLLIHQA